MSATGILQLQEAVRVARADRRSLCIVGGNSKRCFLGREFNSELDNRLEIGDCRGIVAYDPTELVVTARAGTPLRELEETLAAHGQMLACESPTFGETDTVGGAIACGFSGPRRPFAGAVRDFVLGVQILNGAGEVMRFGGRVMKNVAGYDVSRLMVGAYGQLGVILEVSLKVVPAPEAEATRAFEYGSLADATGLVNGLIRRSLPVTATCHQDGLLHVRFSGRSAAVGTAVKEAGGAAGDERLWARLRNFRHPFFGDADEPLWRSSVPATAPELDLKGEFLVTWNGAERWYRGRVDAEAIRSACAAVGGHATHFWGGIAPREKFHPLSGPLAVWHQGLKAAFDPERLFNPGLMYAWL